MGFQQGLSGLNTTAKNLEVIGNNVANVSTTGYKSSRVDLADSFSQTLRSSSPSNGTSSSVPSIQVGTGVQTSTIKSQFTQGALARTGVGTDLAVAGSGFFIVADPVSGIEYATRAGEFRVDDGGYLITNSGQRVQGWAESTLAAGTYDDIRIDTTGNTSTAVPTPTMQSYSIDDRGRINVSLSDGTSFVRGQILLQNFSDPQALLKEGNNLYSGMNAAGPLGGATPTPVEPGSNGLGLIYSGALELSNVDLATEFTNLITTQRAYQANARIITTSDEMLQELVNLKR